MKKVFCLILLLTFGINGVSAFESAFVDNFAMQTLDKNLKIKKQVYVPIEDSFAKNTLNQDLKIYNNTYVPIKDEFAAKIQNYEKIFYDKNQKFDFESLKLNRVAIRPIKFYTTRKKILVGDILSFKLESDFNYQGVNYKKGDILTARVENLNLNKAYGVPADMIVGDFRLPHDKKINGEIFLKGANRALWVHPVAYTTTIFFGLGIFVWTIRGGHAKLSPRKVYNLNFES